MPKISNIQSIEFKPNYFCNDRCSFCSFHDKKEMKMMDTYSIKSNIDYFQNQISIKEIVFSGGEPSIRSDFLELLQYVNQVGIKNIYLHTNGIKFSDVMFLKKHSDYITRALIGYHSHNEALYNLLSDKNNFRQKNQGIKNLLESGIPVRVNTVIVELNYRDLPSIAKSVVSLGVKDALLTFPFPIGGLKENFDMLVVKDYNALFNKIFEVTDIYKDNNIRIRIQGLPLCYLKDLSKYRDIWHERILIDYEHQYDDYMHLFTDVVGCIKKEECKECIMYDDCEGFWIEYMDQTTFEGFKPIK